ncbi:MAG: beta strand repeat-containing protein [Bdellovibrionia bacterium]
MTRFTTHLKPIWVFSSLCLALAGAVLPSSASAATVTVSSNTTWAAGANSGADVVVSGAILTLGAGAYSFNSLTIQSTGIVTGTGLTITIAGDLTINTGTTFKSDTLGNGTGTASTTQPTYQPSGGGGAIKLIVAGTTTVAGTLSANGAAFGAAGGSIWLQTATLAGAGTMSTVATFSAGGYIAIYYSSGSTFSGTISTAYLFYENSTTGDLSCPFNTTVMFDPNDALPGYAAAIASLTVTNGCRYGFKYQATGASASLTVPTMTINSGSYFSADGRGYPAASGPGAGANYLYSGGGGAHGGVGTNGYNATAGGTTTYDSGLQPTLLGSGGGSATSSGSAGGAGGGAIKLIVSGTLTVNGALSANGNDTTITSSASGGGGAGGSLWLQVGTLAGTGSITAKGGTAPSTSTQGGGGGGGRIAIYYSSANSFTGTVSAAGGSGYASSTGGAGTYFLQNSTSGDVTCSSAINMAYESASPPSTPINNLSVSGGCSFAIVNSTLTAVGDVTIGSGSSIHANGLGTGAGTASTTQPTYQGAAGGGGGAIKLIVAGTTTIDGTLSANGTVAGKYAGSIWLQTATLAGAGTISATVAGATALGGYIAIYYSTSSSFSGTINVAGSPSSLYGSFFYQNSTTGDLSCPFSITTYFNPADSLPGYAAAINNVLITNGCRYGFKNQATGTSATLTALGDMTIDSTSYFSADSKGGAYGTAGSGAGGSGSSGWGGGGAGYGGAGAKGSGTGGGTGGITYGSATQPVSLGSYGGEANSSISTGGSGGGAIKLAVSGTLTVNGTLSATGGTSSVTSTYSGGGGSGGSIWLQVGTLAGTGTISVKGGDAAVAAGRGGGGGGGRIAIYYGTALTFTGTTTITGGAGGATGSNGTYFVQNSGTGDVVCNSAITTYYDPSSPPATTIHDVSISNGCSYVVQNGTMSITGNLTIASGSSMNANGIGAGTGTASTTQPTLQGASGGGGGAIKLIVSGTTTVDGTLSANGTVAGKNAGSIWLQTSSLAGSGTISAMATSSLGGYIALYYSSSSTFSGSVVLTGSSNGSLFYQNSATGDLSCPFPITTYFNPADALPGYAAAIHDVSVTNGCHYGFPSLATGTSATLAASNLTIDSASYFTADAMGSASDTGTGKGAAGSTNGGGGGGYGGTGANGSSNVAAGGPAYGSPTQPVSLGSGGGNTNSSFPAKGGSGGGAIKLVISSSLTVNGTLSANGGISSVYGSGTTYSGGGGSGGSIWVQTGVLAGTGNIQAKGGDAAVATGRGGGGGGGRIALYFTTNSFTGAYSVAGGTGYATGSQGTIAGLYPADKLLFYTQPAPTGRVGVALAQQPDVMPVSSTHNNWPDVNYTGSTSVTLAAYTDNTCATSLTGATVADSPKTIAYGEAAFTAVSLNKRNSGNPIYLKATSGSLTSVCSTSITLSPGPASQLAFTVHPSTSNYVNSVFATVPKVAAQDAEGSTDTTYATAIAVDVYSDNTCATPVAGGTLTNGSATPSSGLSTFTGIKYSLANTGSIPSYYFKASSGGLTTACSNAFTVSALAPPFFFRGW